MPTTNLLIKEEEEHILRILPVLLRKDDHFRREVSVILSETLATKDELNKVLEEIRLSREETNQRFAEMREETNRRFEAMDKRFSEMREETNRRFEAMDKRFEAMDKRFEAMHEEMHRGFDEQRKETRKLGMSIRTIGSRWGIEAEATIRNTLRELLLKDMKVAEVSEWRTKDKNGVVGSPNSEIQVDILIKNGEHYLAEIKSSADSAHVNRFYKIGELYNTKEKIKPKLLFIAVIMDDKGAKLCQELGIQLITYDELE
ncbi:DUF3782 domain-containing protein [bacterium]|nr:DUF3782 domain-containing protein [bacterium]